MRPQRHTPTRSMNTPGQWLTPEYIIEHQNHFCPKHIDQTAIRAALPWRRKDL